MTSIQNGTTRKKEINKHTDVTRTTDVTEPTNDTQTRKRESEHE